jgi:glycosyltransferase involved in cell wall biosynthesis
MKIVHIILGKANPNRMNGVNKVVHEMATNQALSGDEVTVFGITGSTKHDYPERPFTTELFPPSLPFTIHPRLKKAIRNCSVDTVFHLHGGFVPAMSAAARYLRSKGRKYIFTPHGSYNVVAMRRSAIRKQVYFQLFEKHLLRGAHAIHCIGKSEVEATFALCGHPSIHLVPYGYTIAVKPWIPLHVEEAGFTYCYMGRLDMHTKGLDLLLEALSLHKYNAMFQLWVIGDGPDRKKMERLVQEYDLSNRVTFLGSLFGEEKWKWLQQADIFVHPSRNEGLPSGVIEACSVYVPCVVTEQTNTGDYMRKYECGEVAPEPTVEEVHKAIRRMEIRLRKLDMIATRNNAHRMVEEEFNWATIVQRLRAIYQS